MTWTQEQRKEYNSKYYSEKKDEILKKALQKVECQFCKRKVIYNNMSKHLTTPICARFQQKILENKKRALCVA